MNNLSYSLEKIEKHTECIILIHGLARTSFSMSKAASIFSKHGYRVVNINYPSRKKDIEQIVNQHIAPIIKKCETKNFSKIHFLTHSMGGILLRYYLSKTNLQRLGNTVMLAPPNQGSEVVDKLGGLQLFHFLYGPAGCQLGTDENSIPMQLGALDFTAGIIMGSKSINPLLSLLIPGKNDGKVSVERAKIPGMKDFLLTPYSHSFITLRSQAIYQALYFIQNTTFYRK